MSFSSTDPATIQCHNKCKMNIIFHVSTPGNRTPLGTQEPHTKSTKTEVAYPEGRRLGCKFMVMLEEACSLNFFSRMVSLLRHTTVLGLNLERSSTFECRLLPTSAGSSSSSDEELPNVAYRYAQNCPLLPKLLDWHIFLWIFLHDLLKKWREIAHQQKSMTFVTPSQWVIMFPLASDCHHDYVTWWKLR